MSGILMTDLEGSTEHLRSLGPDYGPLLASHHRILREAVAAEGGVEVGSEGDSLAAVFPDSSAALRAAVTAQRQLLGTAWPDSPWLDRMAVHSGEVVVAESGAVGMALHEAARVRNVAHGGQVIVTEMARSSAAEPMEPDVELTDLGSHPMRDFSTAVRLYQVRAQGLPTSFPALRTMATKAVPASRNSFVGRDEDIEVLLESIDAARIVTVTGPGGSGKTRLAYEAARRADVHWTVVVELAGVREQAQVEFEVASALGARRPEDIEEVVGGRHLLLVLDNCEHMIEAVGRLVSRICDCCPAAVILATSRESLGIAGEVVWPVPTLGLADAIDLFRTRAPAVGETDLVGVVCERLGGMPLAIELAAARVRSMTLTELVSRLDDQLGLLTTGSRDIPRQQTLRATLEWSHALLTAEERVVFRRLAVFAGGFTLSAAEAVARLDHEDVLGGLDGLIAKSLLDLSPSAARYRLLEPVRQFALEQLMGADERDAVQEAHARWASGLAREANRFLFAEQRKWTEVLDAERDNMAAAIGWALSHGHPEAACSLMSNLAWYWFTSSRRDSHVWVPLLLEKVDLLSVPDRAKALLAAGITYCDDFDDERPVPWLRESAEIYRTLANRRSLGAALFWLGRAEAGRSDFDTAEKVFVEAVSVHEELGDLFGLGWTLTWTGILARLRGDLDDDEQIQMRVLELCESVPHVAAQAWSELSRIAATRGDVAVATDQIARAEELYRALGDKWQLGMMLGTKADYLLHTEPDVAREHLIEALTLQRELGAEPNLCYLLETAAALLLAQGHPSRAATIVGAVGKTVAWGEQSQWEPFRRPMLRQLSSLMADTAYTRELGLGQRMGVRGTTDAAIGWLKETSSGA